MVGVKEVDVIWSPANNENYDHQSEHLDQLLLVLPDADGGGPRYDHLGLSLLLISSTNVNTRLAFDSHGELKVSKRVLVTV